MKINHLYLGNSLDIMKEFPDNSINLILTSPPYYNQRVYENEEGLGNEKTPEEYIENLFFIFKECNRIIKDDGSIIFNIGDKYINGDLALIPFRFALKVKELKEIKLINEITWIKSNISPSNVKKRLNNSTEPFFHWVKYKDYYYNDNLWSEQEKRVINKSSNKGKSYFEQIKKSNLNEEQKQLAVKALEEALTEFNNGDIADLRMKIKGIHHLDKGGRFGSKWLEMENNGFAIIKSKNIPICHDWIECGVGNAGGNEHPASFPSKLIKKLIQLTTKENDLVFDPFCGSGTTLYTAKQLNRNWIGIDIHQKYLDLTLTNINKYES